MIVIGCGNAAIDENERLLLNAFHGHRAGELGRRRDGEAFGQNLPDGELRMIHRQAHEADIEAAGDQRLDLVRRRHVGNLDFDSGAGLAEFEQSARNQTKHGGYAYTEA